MPTYVVLLHGREGIVKGLNIGDTRLGIGGDAWNKSVYVVPGVTEGNLALRVHLYATNASLGSFLYHVGRQRGVELRTH